MIRVTTEEVFQRDSVAVFITEHRRGGGASIWRHTDHGWVFEAISEHASPTTEDPSLMIPRDFISPLTEALSDFAPPDRAQATHLADAREVRDRLLTLVEGTVLAFPIGPHDRQIGEAIVHES